MTPNKIDVFLNELRNALEGCDPALVQDALSDAEDHLRTALKASGAEVPDISENAQVDSILDKYGSPREIADAYRDLEKRSYPFIRKRETRHKTNLMAGFFGVLSDPAAWSASLYMLFSVLTGSVFGFWVLFGGAFCLFSLILIIGIPVAGLFILSIRGIALVEGRLIEALLHMRMPRKPLFLEKGLSWKQKLTMIITEGHTWKVMAYLILQLPLSFVYSLSTLFLFSLSAKFMAYPVLNAFFGRSLLNLGGPIVAPPWMYPLVFLGGAFAFAGTLHLAKWAGRLHSRYAKAMLVRK